MREIKFRQWDAMYRVMIQWEGDPGGTSEAHQQGLKEAIKQYGFEEIANNSIFMQYTGLKDKNGKEIYEGDIVHCISQWDEANMVVIFEEGEFRMVLCDNYKGYVTGCGFYAIRTFSKEVIGNIYEHPHLLKGDEANAQTT